MIVGAAMHSCWLADGLVVLQQRHWEPLTTEEGKEIERICTRILQSQERNLTRFERP
jgi:hypothetical protein